MMVGILQFIHILGTKQKKANAFLPDLSEISATELEENYNLSYSVTKSYKHVKTHHKQRRKKDHVARALAKGHNIIKDGKKKTHRNRKKIADSSDSSDETGSEYRNKRRKLANAVIVNKEKVDKTSLSARLKTMLGSTQDSIHEKSAITQKKEAETENNVIQENNNVIDSILSPVSSKNDEEFLVPAEVKDKLCDKNIESISNNCELIDLCSDDDKIAHNKDCFNSIVCSNNQGIDEKLEDENINASNTVTKKTLGKRNSTSEKDSDDDLELLRQNALQTKPLKAKTAIETENKTLSEDEDSDTAELRLICLKSALLKKAIEMKQKKRLQKKLSQSNLQDDFLNEQHMFPSKINSDNNTDIESVDMDIGSDGDDKNKETEKNGIKNSDIEQNSNQENNENNIKDNPKINLPKEDDFDEDEDLLRAKLLTSLSKNLPNLVNSSILDAIPNFTPEKTAPIINRVIKKVPEEKRFIIKLGESDSEGEHEATKNLTKMHMKLSENLDFQQKLDSFLKTTRMQVEKSSLPDVIQENTAPKKTEKYVAKAVKHLPKPEQIEYKNLVRRMAELEKIKQTRQVIIHIHKSVPPKDTLKPRNISLESQKTVPADVLEEQIAMSRKKIAEESAKMLKLKEEATKLSQKYKIVATELRNIATAITLNKKQQKFVQNGLNKIRLQHQTLLRSNTITKHSQGNIHFTSLNKINKKIVPPMKLQKENDPHKEDHKNQHATRLVKIATAEVKDDIHVPSPRISIQVDVASNKKIVKLPKSPDKERHIDLKRSHVETEPVIVEHIHTQNDIRNEVSHPVVEKGGGYPNFPLCDHSTKRRKSLDDYKSPLQSLESSSWRADPNAILCPFEVGGECKDTDCKYLHTNIITQ
ncbi:hypothetical protein O3G_MSEX005312 [Manduca sexta]|uniref:Putative zinc-finger domain-containing protein n=1 Tax=Manduca sexta TaxID=7130 RepID=A0A922CJD2_MANSE|nr:hypothetical protein O3G_MSEX005312 [Manduca sexta]